MHTKNIQLRDVRRLLKNAKEWELSESAVLRLRAIAYALEHDCNVSLTCRHYGIARSTFMRWVERFDALRPQSLEEQSRSPHRVRTMEVDQDTVDLIGSLRKQHPTMGKEKIREILKQSYGVSLSSSTVGRVITRHKFFFADTHSHKQKRGVSDVQSAAFPSFIGHGLAS